MSKWPPARRVLSFATWLFLLLVTVFLVVLVWYSVRLLREPDGLTALQSLASLSNIALMLLTATYVAITAGQLELMKTQLDEMKASRLFQSQPVVVVSVRGVRVERPRLYIGPTRDKPRFLSRVHVDYVLRNIGADPAISVSVTPEMRCKSGSVTRTEHAATERLEHLATASESVRLSALFVGDEDCLFLKGLLETQPDVMDYADEDVWTMPPLDSTPLLQFAVVYRNPLGGCFTSRCAYRVACALENWETAKNWFAILQTAPLAYQDYLRCISVGRNWDRNQAEEAFRAVNSSLDEKVGPDMLPMRAYLLPSRSVIRTVSEECHGDPVGSVR